MKATPKIVRDRDRVLFQYPPGNGKPARIEEYFTVRGAVSWPTPVTPGYYCILGLLNAPTLNLKYPLKLLAEGMESLPEKFFEKVAIYAQRLYTERLLADISNERGTWEDSFRQFVRANNLHTMYLQDAAAFMNDIDHCIMQVRQWKLDGALEIPEKTIMLSQLSSIALDDAKEIDEKFYAVSALMKVLMSFEVYPWKSDPMPSFGFTNISGRGRRSGDEGYSEYYTK